MFFACLIMPIRIADGVTLQAVLDDITIAPNAGVSSINTATDALSDAGDSYWSITATGGSISTIIELSPLPSNNIFGVYDTTDPLKKVELFNGATAAGEQAMLSIKADGSVYINIFTDTGVDFAGNSFGYYLDSTYYVDGGLWYSDTSLNSDVWDHMVGYQGLDIDTVQIASLTAGLWTKNEYVLAFEGTENTQAPVSNADFTDFVVMVESVGPVPEPATLLLFGLGVPMLSGLRKKG